MAFPAESAPSQGYQPQGLISEISWTQEFSPKSESNQPFSHPLQERIAREWRPLLDANGEGCPARRLSVVVDQADKLATEFNGLSIEQLDGDMDEETMDDVVRHMSYLKMSVMGTSTALGIDVGSFVERKMFEKMQVKYPPDSVYALISSGMAPLDAMAYLKNAYNNDLEPFVPRVEVSPEEMTDRLPRIPGFKDPYQDVTDVWQRRAFGRYLLPSERIPNLSGEVTEFLDEFKAVGMNGHFRNMSVEEVNALVKSEKTTTAHDPEGVDPVQDKLIAIGGEAADVVIAVDGYAAALGRDQEVDANAALDRTILKYVKTKRIVRESEGEISERKAMELLKETEYRVRRGLKPPSVPHPGVAAVIAAIRWT